ncbi:hypothetical protein ACMFMG_010963 [Clarireedia jacksonii]
MMENRRLWIIPRSGNALIYRLRMLWRWRWRMIWISFSQTRRGGLNRILSTAQEDAILRWVQDQSSARQYPTKRQVYAAIARLKAEQDPRSAKVRSKKVLQVEGELTPAVALAKLKEKRIKEAELEEKRARKAIDTKLRSLRKQPAEDGVAARRQQRANNKEVAELQKGQTAYSGSTSYSFL